MKGKTAGLAAAACGVMIAVAGCGGGGAGTAAARSSEPAWCSVAATDLGSGASQFGAMVTGDMPLRVIVLASAAADAAGTSREEAADAALTAAMKAAGCRM